MIIPQLTIPDKINRLILKYFDKDELAYQYYYTHCLKVTELALNLADANPELNLDKEYLLAAGMLHDMGIIKTNAPEIGCNGKHPYICHTYLGRKILEKNGFEHIAPVCERHLGVGLSKKDIKKSGFPLPHRDMIPITNEEKLICYADKFYSKNDKHLLIPKPMDKIRIKIKKYGKDKREKFEKLITLFGDPHENGIF
jgi:uncharacterized protein